MATPSVQRNNLSQGLSQFRTSGSNPDLTNPQMMVDSLIRHKLETSDQLIQGLRQELRSEKDRNRILETQVTSLEAVIAQLLDQAEQYHYEALVNEKKVKDLEAKLDKEATKRHAHVKTAQKLENAVDRVKTLEKQLKVQIDIRANESMHDDQLAWSTVENVVLRSKVSNLEKDLAHEKFQRRIHASESAPDYLSSETASAIAEVALIKDRLAMNLKYAPSTSGPCDEYAACAVENAALKEQVDHLAGMQAMKDVAEIQAEVRLEAVQSQIEELKSLEAQYDKLSAACVELESRRASVVAPSSLSMSELASSFSIPDEQLAYALVENKLLRERQD